MLASSAYLTKRCPRRSSSRSSSSSTTLLSSGESGPPCGVPSTLGLTSPSSIRLRDSHPSHRFRFVGPVQQLFPDDWPVLLQIVAKLIDHHPVDACATFVAHHLPQCFLQIPSLTYFLHDSTRIGWGFGLIHHRGRFDVFTSRLPGFTRRRR